MNSNENISQSSGIYVILNILDWRAYVGQAGCLNNRDHRYDLEKGEDNNQTDNNKSDNNISLQSDYNDDKEFVYMIVHYGFDKKEEINKHEGMWMTLMEEFGFELYNIIRNNTDQARNNRDPSNLGIDETDYFDAKESFVNDFTERFGITPEKLFQCSDLREDALNHYADKRLTDDGRKKFDGDKFYFNRQRLQSIFNNKTISLSSLDIDEMLISKAGDYLGEGIDQILKYELESISKNKYCLWTFAYHAVSLDVVREQCNKRKQDLKDTYVLFEYTVSAEYADAVSERFNCLRKLESKKISKEDLDFLSFKDKDGNLYVPDDIDCTATYGNDAKAFVITDLFLLDEVIDPNKIHEYYEAVIKTGLKEIYKTGRQRSTHYIKKVGTFKMEDILINPDCSKIRRKFCFVGKLASPYLLPLHKK